MKFKIQIFRKIKENCFAQNGNKLILDLVVALVKTFYRQNCYRIRIS
jgi:hypothetical protein